ncbi:hypothetical protein [uncultured Thiodictyon sp.]|uniref:hypothetical protein n=1 Tax=uncultured Thiodictyon sp. TaxID=1846217 RepID=UPI0025EA3334|nr:hypothetical protein [uncultured Thiodictyon sp.]
MPLPHTPPKLRRAARPFAWLIPGIGTIALIALLAGCSTWRGPEPALRASGPDTPRCREECNLLRTQCKQRQENRELGCAERHTVAVTDYDRCIKTGGRNCQEPYSCLGADLAICRREYAPCARGCGMTGEPPPDATTGPATAPKADETASPTQHDQTAPPAKTDKADKTGGAAG